MRARRAAGVAQRLLQRRPHRLLCAAQPSLRGLHQASRLDCSLHGRLPGPRLRLLNYLQLRSKWTSSKTPYEVLGIGPTATAEEIKKAYFDLARRCHPDVYEAEDAQHRFQEVSSAYALLSDEDARHSYEAQAGIFRAADAGKQTSAKDMFDRVFRDQRLRNPVLAAEERALYAIMEQRKGNQTPTRDFVVDYRLPPQMFLPRRAMLEAQPGADPKGPQTKRTQKEKEEDEERSNTIFDFFSKSPISGGG